LTGADEDTADGTAVAADGVVVSAGE
ncbi:MAG: hypothetical protein JWL64_805, partial [Frankiales bacterium]|nr:hypothetical protein [Frankiales bacterium]